MSSEKDVETEVNMPVFSEPPICWPLFWVLNLSVCRELTPLAGWPSLGTASQNAVSNA